MAGIEPTVSCSCGQHRVSDIEKQLTGTDFAYPVTCARCNEQLGIAYRGKLLPVTKPSSNKYHFYDRGTRGDEP